MMNGGYWGMGWGMWLIPVIIILVIYFLVRNNSKTQSTQSHDSPLEIMKKRYAAGEITREEFEKMKNDLSNN